MADTLGRRIFLSHLELSYRLGRKVTLAEFGAMIAEQMGRDTPFTGAAVSRWESGTQTPTPQIIEAIAALSRMDPGWISHGDRSAAPRPARIEGSASHDGSKPPRTPIVVPAKKKSENRRKS
jgi:transcriptional regulator with XRE-family HTH domain